MTIDIKAIRTAAKEDQKRDNTILLRPSIVLAMCDEIERLRKDAARYPWLRDPDTDLEAFAATYYPGKEVPAGDELDAAIDAAMECLK